MTHTTIIHIHPNDRIEYGPELQNAWGSAPLIWDALCVKYFGLEPLRFMSSDMKRLWSLWKDKDLPISHRAVLMMTFDRAYVSFENFARAAGDIRKFLEDFPTPPDRVNHWGSIAEYFESMPSVPAIGFWHTSVSDNPFAGRWDEALEEYGPPNWDELYEIYTELEKL